MGSYWGLEVWGNSLGGWGNRLLNRPGLVNRNRLLDSILLLNKPGLLDRNRLLDKNILIDSIRLLNRPR